MGGSALSFRYDVRRVKGRVGVRVCRQDVFLGLANGWLHEYERRRQSKGIAVASGPFGKWKWAWHCDSNADEAAIAAAEAAYNHDLPLINNLLFGGPVPVEIRRMPPTRPTGRKALFLCLRRLPRDFRFFEPHESACDLGYGGVEWQRIHRSMPSLRVCAGLDGGAGPRTPGQSRRVRFGHRAWRSSRLHSASSGRNCAGSHPPSPSTAAPR